MVGIDMKWPSKLAIGSVVVTLLGVGWYFLTHQSLSQSTQSPQVTQQKDVVIISNKSLYSSQFSDSSFNAAQDLLYNQIKLDIPSPKPTYTATIRGNSLIMIDPDEQQILVDIPDIKHTYILDFSTANGSSNQIVNVMCPNSSQLIYGEFDCHAQ